MYQQELLELIGVSKIVLLLVFRGISIVKGIKITVSYLEDLQQIKELKRGGVIWEKIVFNGGWTISKISVTKAYLMTVMYFILNAWDFAFLELFKMNCPSSWHFGTTIAHGTLKTVSHPVEYLIVYTTIVVCTIIYQRTTKYDKSFTKSSNTFGCSEEFSELAMIIIQRQNLSMPKTVSEAETLYITIVNEISSIWRK